MGSTSAALVCIAYGLGLLFTAVPFGGWIVLGLGIGGAIAARKFWYGSPKPAVWLIAGMVGLLATFYFHWKTPQPAPHDISRLLSTNAPSAKVLVEGKVDSLPRTTRSQKAQFWLKARQIAPIGDGKPVTGKVYVTAPMDQATKLHPGQIVSISGSLYLPKEAANPGGFDFKAYLQQEGSFAGLAGESVELRQDFKGWGWWQVQQRIVQAQAQGLGNPEGALVSAMVLGSKAVDLPAELKDGFKRAGLAHALAASGFQTSLILGVVLAMTRRFPARVQFVAGSLSLGGFVALAGLQPAVLRAALMGFGGLVALVLNRKVKPLGSLLVTATILLIVNPWWIWDLGFQLSFLATMGLLVTVPALTKRLDWVPVAIAPLIAVPLAAYLWTLPLQLGAFGVLSPYSIPANLVTTPFISIISLGGMASALAALIWVPAGAALAWLLKYPTIGLMAIVRGFNQLPGNSYAVGTIPVLTVVGLYLLLLLTTFHPWWRRRWQIVLFAGFLTFAGCVWMGSGLTQFTVLATANDPILVARDKGRVAVVNSGDAKTVQLTLVPFLQQAGLNQVNWAIAPDPKSSTPEGWQELTKQLPLNYFLKHPAVADLDPGKQTQPKRVITITANQPAKFGNLEMTILREEPAIAQFMLHHQSWLWFGKLTPDHQKTFSQANQFPSAEVLCWSGKTLPTQVFEQVKPKVAIASAKAIDPELETYLKQHNIQLYVTGRDGAIQWEAGSGFKTMTESDHSSL